LRKIIPKLFSVLPKNALKKNYGEKFLSFYKKSLTLLKKKLKEMQKKNIMNYY